MKEVNSCETGVFFPYVKVTVRVTNIKSLMWIVQYAVDVAIMNKVKFVQM